MCPSKTDEIQKVLDSLSQREKDFQNEILPHSKNKIQGTLAGKYGLKVKANRGGGCKLIKFLKDL